MQQLTIHQSMMYRLFELATLVGVGQPKPDESARAYGVRILVAIDPTDEFLDDEVRFQVLALINQKNS